MKLRNYQFLIALMITTLFSSCKQSLQMQGDYEYKELQKTNISYNNTTELLFEAVIEGDKDSVKELLLTNVDVNCHDGSKENNTPLHIATAKGFTEVARLLIKGGADLNAKDQDGWTPLHEAAEEGNTEIAELLIKAKADVNSKDNAGWTPLYLAADNGNTEIAKLLIKSGADVNVTNNYGWTLLHVAAENGNKGIAELLIKGGADVNAKDEDGDTPLHLAAQESKTEIAELLINRVIDVNEKDNEGMTPLHWATETNNLDFCNLIKDILLGKNEEYNTKNKVNRFNKLCCLKHFLIGKSIISNIMYDKSLIRAIVKFSDLNIDLSIKNMYDQTPLDIAREKDHTDIIEILEELENVIKNDQLIPFTDYIASN